MHLPCREANPLGLQQRPPSHISKASPYPHTQSLAPVRGIIKPSSDTEKVIPSNAKRQGTQANSGTDCGSGPVRRAPATSRRLCFSLACPYTNIQSLQALRVLFYFVAIRNVHFDLLRGVLSARALSLPLWTEASNSHH